MKLYYKPGACSLSPHIVLRELGQTFTLEKVDLSQKKTESGKDYLQVNPKGKVPALLLNDGNVLTEGPAIVLYLADTVPNAQLIAPLGYLARYHTIESLNYIATELHKSFSYFFNPATLEDLKESLRVGLVKQFNYLEEVLSGRKYLQGGAFTIADAYLFTILRWAYELMSTALEHCMHLLNYFNTIKKRPSVQEALINEGLV